MGALDVYDDHKEFQIEGGTFSESFTFDPDGVATTIKGIFDESYITDERDQGNVRQQKLKPRVLVYEIPSGVVYKESKLYIPRLDKTYTILKADKDDQGVIRLWLL